MKDKNEIVAGREIVLGSPLAGRVVALDDVADEVFSQKILGDGASVCPSGGVLHAPADARVVQVFESGHAITLLSDDGVELLLHIGIDTVSLRGKCFAVKVEAGQRVRRGETLIEFDRQGILDAGYDVTTPMIVSNSDEFELCVVKEGEIAVGEPLMHLTRRTKGEGRA